MKEWEVCVQFRVKADTPERAAGIIEEALGVDGHNPQASSVREVHPPRPPVATRGREIRDARYQAWKAGHDWAVGGIPAMIFDTAAAMGVTDAALVTEFVLGAQNTVTMALLDRQDAARERARKERT